MRKGKIIVILLVILIVLPLVLAGGVFYLLQTERKHTAQLEEELDDIKSRQRTTEADLEKYKNAAVTLDSKLHDANIAIEELNIDFQREKDAKQKVLYEMEQLKVDLEQQKSLRADLEKNFSQTQADVQKLQTQLEDLTNKKAELETKLQELEAKSQGVELGKIVVSNEGQAPRGGVKEEKPKAAIALEGKILVVNKDYNFIVINLGGKDGVQLGDIFSIYHGNKYAGEVTVEKVHDSMSAAGFKGQDLKDKISEGDKVMQKAK